jgi:hypothetical protein
MKYRWLAVVAVVCVLLSSGAVAQVRKQAPARKDAVMTMRASGTFDVKLAPQPADDRAEAAAIGRMSIDKQFHGDLAGTSVGQMLMTSTAVPGSAGYVAIEKVSGTLKGKAGSFMLQHTGIMDRGAASLSVTVVPDSGTGDLLGLSGRLDIIIEGGKHSYTFDYTIAPR